MTALHLNESKLLSLIGRDVVLRRVASTKGGEYAGPCPFCGGADRLRVWPDHPTGKARWRCMGFMQGRAGCGRGGDTIAYLVERGDITLAEAWRLRRGETLLGAPAVAHPPQLRPRLKPVERLLPPKVEWQAAARSFVAESQERLWSASGIEALSWLRSRCLSDETIRTARLGWNPADLWSPAQRWGFPDGKNIWLPRGWVIPCEIGGNLWRVDIRRPEGKPKYIGPRGNKNVLYNADALQPSKPAILVEGVFDALTIGQTAGDLVTPVAACSTSGARGLRWIAKLALCPLVLVSFDAEVDKGDRAAAWWVGTLPNARRWRPYWGDANAMAQAGVDLRQWIMAGTGGLK